MITIVIADDHAIFRQGLLQLLGSDKRFSLLGEADNGTQLLELIDAIRPDVAIVDVSMDGPGVAGICQHVAKQELVTKVIVLTMHQSVSMARHLLSSGAVGYVLKKNAFDDLRTAIVRVGAGETFVSPALAVALIQNLGTHSATMTQRELEVVRLVASGHTNRRIARQLSISVKTVETHRARAMQKLDVHSAAELVRCAVNLGLISSETV